MSNSGLATSKAKGKLLDVTKSLPFGMENTEQIYDRRISLPEELQINMRWQWDNNIDTCRNALFSLVVSSQPNLAIAELERGQAHNPHVGQLYQTGFETLNTFWDLLVSSSTWSPDFGELQINLNWQFENNLQSLADAHKNFSAPNTVAGMYYLMEGQHHNPNVMNLYRACYSANRARLIGLVKSLIEGS